MAEQEPQKVEATQTTEPQAEALKPAGPSVAELEAKIANLEAKYTKEVGDRDVGMARQAKALKETKLELSLAQDALARKLYGEDTEATEKSEYQRWKEQYGGKPESEKPSSPAPTLSQGHLLASGRMIEAAEVYGVDYEKPPADLAPLVAEVTSLYAEKPQEAAERWRTGLKKRADDLKAKADAEAKAKQEEANQKARLGQRDTSTSTGGSEGSYQAVRDAWMKNPNDPATLRAYMEARNARGI